VGGLGGANFSFVIGGVKTDKAKERGKARNDANEQQIHRRPKCGLARDDNVKKEQKKKDKPSEQQVPRRPESGLARDDKLKDRKG
jgi:hypothetical protein